MMAEYVHGYAPREARRLADQSGLLEEVLHQGTVYAPGSTVLEAGCGVGAQTEILVRRHPGIVLTSADISGESLEQARRRMEALGAGAVTFRQADVLDLPFADASFDHVFVCFLLEHLADPGRGLRELRRVLRPGGTLTAIEGDHGSAFFHPEREAARCVWRCLIRAQQELGHDPLIGRRLGVLLKRAGLAVEGLEPRWIAPDVRDPPFLDGVVNRIMVPMVQTARRHTLARGWVDQQTWDRGIRELAHTANRDDGMYFYTWFKGMARNPG